MALINVNPTRMEMTRLKKRLATSIRGHKLLKDKRDDLMKKFLDLIRKNKELREQVEQEINDIYGGFVVASAVMSPQMLEEALMLPKQSIDLEVGERNVMSVEVPSFEFIASESGDSDIYSYGFVSTSGELDDSVAAVKNVLPHLLELAQIEKSAQMIAEEIERTRRRVNALEYVQIPRPAGDHQIHQDEAGRKRTWKPDPSDEGQGHDAQRIDRAKARDHHQYLQRLTVVAAADRQSLSAAFVLPSAWKTGATTPPSSWRWTLQRFSTSAWRNCLNLSTTNRHKKRPACPPLRAAPNRSFCFV